KFWQMLCDKKDAVVPIPKERWEADAFYDPDPEAEGKMYTREAGFLEEPINYFDPGFFGISPREAKSMPPQHRLLLEVSWEALERAGQSPDDLKKSQTGVFTGLSINDYEQYELYSEKLKHITPYTGIGSAYFLPGRLSYFLGLHGPCFPTDTACSTSMVTVHLACQSLRAGECDLALAGGGQVILLPNTSIWLSKMKTLSPDARCKSFDADADGYVRGEGCGIVVLKRLSDSLADKDNILAVIRGSGINHDGAGDGFTVPNENAQKLLIRQVLERAKIKPDAISYVEAHGTGTPVGDPVEVRAICSALGKKRSSANPLMIGSVKSNIGHLETGAGIASVIKTVLCLQHKEIPGNLHFKKLNPKFRDMPVKVVTEYSKWSVLKGQKRLAGVNSFGISGINAHLLIEEAPYFETKEPGAEHSLHILTLSGKTEKAIKELSLKYVDFLQTNPDESLADICFTANTGRSHFDYRLAAVSESAAQLCHKLESFARGENVIGLAQNNINSKKHPGTAFLFTGQGSQYPNMGKQLYKTQPVFRNALDKCSEILESYMDIPLPEILWSDSCTSKINETAYTQPALFALEYALFQLWKSWGIVPDMVMGHSVGEYTAACVAGVFSLEHGLKMISMRGSLMQQLPKNGSMAAIFAPEPQVLSCVEPYKEKISIAAYNGPGIVVISGHHHAMEAICTEFGKEGIKTVFLPVSHAFHSPLTEPILEKFRSILKEIPFSLPRIKLISNLSGEVVSEKIASPEYWVNHTRQPVQFKSGMEALEREGCHIFLECGPKPVLLRMGKQCLPENKGLWLPSLGTEKQDLHDMLAGLGKLYVHGLPINWAGFYKASAHRKLQLPTYAWQRQRYWSEGSRDLPAQKTLKQAVIHPLLGYEIFSAACQHGMLFESFIGLDSHPYFADHCAFQTPLVPAAAFLETALAAGKAFFKTHRLEVSDFEVQQALVIPENLEKRIQLVIDPDEDQCRFKIFSLHIDEQETGHVWTLHVSGKISIRDNGKIFDTIDIKGLESCFEDEVSSEDFYEKFRRHNLDYGPAFRGVKKILKKSGESLTQLRLPKTLTAYDDTRDYFFHPALLDAAFQSVSTVLPYEELGSDMTWLPIGIENVAFYRSWEPLMWCKIHIDDDFSAEKETCLVEDISIFTPDGELSIRIKGFLLKKASVRAMLRDTGKRKDWLHEIQWILREKDEKTISLLPGEQQHWLIFADQQGTGQEMARRLTWENELCTLVFPGQGFERVQENEYKVNPDNPGDFEALITGIIKTNNQHPDAIVHLWTLDSFPGVLKTDDFSHEDLDRASQKGGKSVLYLIQSLIKTNITDLPALYLVTQNTQRVLQEDINPLQSSLWGMARVIAIEHPELWGKIIDMDSGSPGDLAEKLVGELQNPDNEDQVVFRGQTRYIARLKKYKRSNVLHIPDQPFQLKLSEYGSMENLVLKAMSRSKPKSNEVQIKVQAAGLNFRDVLNSLGMLREYYAEYLGILNASDLTFGFECVGQVTATGDDVSGFKIGDKVMGVLAHDALGSFVNLPVEYIVKKPEKLSFKEAATIPLVFLTAFYGLDRLAQIQPNDKILIHAAAGGVGLAAVQTALMKGAEIFATASPGKWEFLKSIGVKHIMNSRTPDFASEIMQATNGKGIDIVLNSLSGEFIEKSLEVLTEGGRFIEIGKQGILTKEQVYEKRPDVSYFPFDLGDVGRENPRLISDMFAELVEQFGREKLKPLPCKAFHVRESIEAFRYMQQAKHIGKIVISFQDTALVRDDATYLITGGLGGLGIKTAEWMAGKGARHLVLTGRSGVSNNTAEETVKKLERSGVEVKVVKVDISDQKQTSSLIEMINHSLPSLRGIIHAAGILEDGILQQASWESFERVVAPKVKGAWNLHILTKDMPLDFFVCFSSIASVMGSPGQGNYAAANAFMDGLVHYRRAQGVPGTSINWGPWAETGMAAEMDTLNRSRTGRTMRFINPDQGLHDLEQILSFNLTQVGVMSVKWRDFQQQFPSGKVPPLFSDLAEDPKKAHIHDQHQKRGEMARLLTSAPEHERYEILAEYIQKEVAKTLELEDSQLPDYDRDFADMGMDSLMAVELKNQIEEVMNCSLPANMVFEFPTINDLAKHLTEDMSVTNPEDPEEKDLDDGIELLGI
ncbi:MAG: type I polyketide synthase, partial [Desulfobacteraceae bacterium]|nr:type I polyketide synthase [Desulfobacteraceae bacterium]